MFGHVEFVVKAAPGAGVVSSAVLQSDCLDEIDWEWLGGDNGQVQSNYFGKGITTTYNRGAYHAAPGNHDGFKTYTIDWTSEQIVWQIDGVTVRALSQSNAAEGQYPQTPMMVKVGAWSGGDPGNAPGTIAWAGGPTDYSAGPYTMYLRSIAVTDYSTGTQYTYSGSAGTWQSIQSTGGTINPKGGANTPTDTSNAPAVTSAASSAPLPFEGTHRDDSSTYVTPSVWPWVGTATATLQTAVSTASVTTYPGLPSGWVVMEDGRVLPPSNHAPVSSSSPHFLFQHFLMSKGTLLFNKHANIYPPSGTLPSLTLIISFLAGLSLLNPFWP
jgi:beta-glucanase (GH16 family)